MLTKLQITYASDSDEKILEFAIRDTVPAQQWARKVLLAQELGYVIDDPARFYGFGEFNSQEFDALARINNCINTINNYGNIISHGLSTVSDQDHLNYLHHIFEVYHGLLDQQTHPFYQQAPQPVKQALADLNVLVHRCESVARGANPRQVVTYYGLPKTDVLDLNDYRYFTNNIQFGTVYLNYCEIGKTLENLAEDDDRYISDSAFQPFQHYSADFNVQFWTADSRQVWEKCVNIKHYYDSHQQWFLDRGLAWGHPLLRSGMLPVADIISDPTNVVKMITHRQWVSSVKIT